MIQLKDKRLIYSAEEVCKRLGFVLDEIHDIAWYDGELIITFTTEEVSHENN